MYTCVDEKERQRKIAYSSKGLDSLFLTYGLRDPRTQLIRYIGKSSSGLNRPNCHRKPSFYLNSTTRLANWCKNMAAAGAMYEIAILQFCRTNGEELEDAERSWIRLFRQDGYDLTNLTDGGDGRAGSVVSAETRAKMSAQRKGRKLAPEVVINMKAAQVQRHRDHPITDASRSKMSASNTGKIVSDTTRSKMSVSQLNKRPYTAEE